MLNRGIILKTSNTENLITIFDYSLGKIWCKNKIKSKLINGLYIEYNLVESKKYLYLENVNALNNPFLISKNNIFFFHHVLEILNFYIPPSIQNREIFEITCYFFNNHEKMICKKRQKIFLCKIFNNLGIHPDSKELSSKLIELIMLPIDIVANIEIDLNIEKVLDFWIDYAIESHPNFKKLNTTRFFKR